MALLFTRWLPPSTTTSSTLSLRGAKFSVPSDPQPNPLGAGRSYYYFFFIVSLFSFYGYKIDFEDSLKVFIDCWKGLHGLSGWLRPPSFSTVAALEAAQELRCRIYKIEFFAKFTQ